jgi:hypothetical protein
MPAMLITLQLRENNESPSLSSPMVMERSVGAAIGCEDVENV